MRNVISDEEVAALDQRNRERAEKAKESLGAKYLLHPDNKAKRNEQSRPVLERRA